MTIKKIGKVYVADTARLIGEIELGEEVNVWYGVSIRGDVAKVTIGRRTNVQDNAVVHCDHGKPLVIGAGVTIGHGAIVHGLVVGDGSLIGMGSTVLGDTKIGKRCLVAAGTVVAPGLEVPDDHVVMGVPGRVVRETREQEREHMKWLSGNYVTLALRHSGACDHLDDPTVQRWSGV